MDSKQSRKNKVAGQWAEKLTVEYLQQRGYHQAERRRLEGVLDRGDVAGVPRTVVEVKNEKSISLAGYLKELAVEMDNAGASRGAVVVRKRGTTDPGEWYAVVPLKELVTLWRTEDGMEGRNDET